MNAHPGTRCSTTATGIVPRRAAPRGLSGVGLAAAVGLAAYGKTGATGAMAGAPPIKPDADRDRSSSKLAGPRRRNDRRCSNSVAKGAGFERRRQTPLTRRSEAATASAKDLPFHAAPS